MSKGPDAFRTISEAADELGVPQHVLRFWETKFSFIRPMKRAGGRRFYRRQDIDVLRSVRRLLHDEGYTIKGVQRLHKEQGIRRLLAAVDGGAPPLAPAEAITTEPVVLEGATALSAQARSRLQSVLRDLESTRGRIDDLLAEGGPRRP